MRLHHGSVPESSDFLPAASGWTALREPSVGLFVWLASGVGLFAGALAVVVWSSTTLLLFAPLRNIDQA
ncbi:MAG: hypothetical protein WD872_12600 [Pirellulaceae bacterium]